MSKEDRKYSVVTTGPPMSPEAIELLEQKASHHTFGAPPSSDQIAALAAEKEADGMIVRQGQITPDVMTASPKLRIVVKHGVGYDNIDIEAAGKLGIPVCITPRANAESVAENALALMLALARNLAPHDRLLRSGTWAKEADVGAELLGKTLGIIGLGRIGRRLAELVVPMRMRVIGFDPFVQPDRFPPEVARAEKLEEILSSADFLSIHCPKTPETTNLISKAELGLMKSTAVLVNTARGGIVNESALLAALEGKRLGGAGIDCFEVEPTPRDNPLLSFEGNLIVTPHIAGVTRESLIRMGTDSVQTLFDYLESGKLESDVVVNRAALARKG